MNNKAYIALGTNMGDKYGNLKEAIKTLKANKSIQLVNTSSIYETEPIGYVNQEVFLNMVIEVNTDLSPVELLDVCLETENAFGRKREIRWGPRTLDLDILLYNQENIEADNLLIPHPRMTERAFVIIPLLEISPNIKLPKMQHTLQSYINDIPDKEGVRIWKLKNGEDVFALFAN